MGSLVQVQSKTQLILNNKLYFKYLLNGFSFSFINNLAQKSKNLNLIITNNSLTYVCLHLRMSTVFYSMQLSDIFTYEVPQLSNYNNHDGLDFKNSHTNSRSMSTCTVYNFHSLYTQDRLFLFILNSPFSKYSGLDSINELFFASN